MIIIKSRTSIKTKPKQICRMNERTIFLWFTRGQFSMLSLNQNKLNKKKVIRWLTIIDQRQLMADENDHHLCLAGNASLSQSQITKTWRRSVAAQRNGRSVDVSFFLSIWKFFLFPSLFFFSAQFIYIYFIYVDRVISINTSFAQFSVYILFGTIAMVGAWLNVDWVPVIEKEGLQENIWLISGSLTSAEK